MAGPRPSRLGELPEKPTAEDVAGAKGVGVGESRGGMRAQDPEADGVQETAEAIRCPRTPLGRAMIGGMSVLTCSGQGRSGQ